jgi:hypothetical protein
MIEKKEEMAPSELWLALQQIPRPTREVPFPRNIPGTDQPVGHVLMWPLTQEEQMAANAEADRWTKKLLADPQKKEEANLGYAHTYTNEVAVQVLVRACRDVKSEGTRPAFPSANQMRAVFSTDEIGVLFSQYCTVQSELGPIRAHMSKEEADAWIVRLAQGGSTFPLDSLSLGLQRTLVLTMASQLVSCWTAMSSAGLQPEVSSFALSYLKEELESGRVEPPPSSDDEE